MTLIPVRCVSSLYHRGHLSKASAPSTQGSHEGCLLSCSLNLVGHDAWTMIARLGGGGSWVLKKERGFKLADIYLLARDPRFLHRLLRAGLLENGFAYAFSYLDGETGLQSETLFDTRREARAEDDGEGDCAILRVPVFRATCKLVEYWCSRHRGMSLPMVIAPEAAVACYLDINHPEIDGVVWMDAFRPSAGSAPKAGLFQRTVLIADKAMKSF